MDTLSMVLSYMFWKLSWQWDVMQRLQAEIDKVMPNLRVVPDASILSK